MVSPSYKGEAVEKLRDSWLLLGCNFNLLKQSLQKVAHFLCSGAIARFSGHPFWLSSSMCKVMGMAHVGIERVQPWSSCPEAAALFPQPLRVKPCSFRSTQEPVLAGWGDTFRLFNGFYGFFCKHRGLYLFGQAPIDLCSRRSGPQEYGGATRKAKLGINFRRSVAYSGETPKGSTGWGLHMVCFPEVGLKST